MKYYKQRGRKDCVPIAILNAYVFSNCKRKYYPFLYTLKEALGYTRERGTFTPLFKIFMKNNKDIFPFSYKYKNSLKLEDIKNALSKGQAILFVVDGHISLIIKDNGKRIKFVNLTSKSLTSMLTYSQMNKLLKMETFGYIISRK